MSFFDKQTTSERPALLRLLCALLGPGDDPTSGCLDGVDIRALMALADGFRVLPGLYLALRRRGLLGEVETDLAEALEAVWLLNRARNADLAAQARALTEALAEIDVQAVYLKGMAQILGGSHLSGARMTSDIDVLVPENRLSEALLHLQARGFSSGYDGPTPITWMRSYAHHAVPIRRPQDPAWVELHKGFFSDPNYLLPASEVLAKARPVTQNGWQAYIPCPEHQVTMAIAHATLRGLSMLGGSASLRDGLDVMALAQQSAIDFTAIETCFRKAGAYGSYAWYSAVLADLFGAGAVVGQRQEWPYLSRLRARAARSTWTRPVLQRMLVPGSALAYALQMLTDRRFRHHFVLLACDKTYRMHWRGGEH